MTFSTWFDINKLEHRLAFRHLYAVGTWPEGFLPESISLSSGWYLFVIHAYLEWVIEMQEKLEDVVDFHYEKKD